MLAACAASASVFTAAATVTPSRLTFTPAVSSYLIGANNTTVSVVADDTDPGYSIKLEIKSPFTDPPFLK